MGSLERAERLLECLGSRAGLAPLFFMAGMDLDLGGGTTPMANRQRRWKGLAAVLQLRFDPLLELELKVIVQQIRSLKDRGARCSVPRRTTETGGPLSSKRETKAEAELYASWHLRLGIDGRPARNDICTGWT